MQDENRIAGPIGAGSAAGCLRRRHGGRSAGRFAGLAVAPMLAILLSGCDSDAIPDADPLKAASGSYLQLHLGEDVIYDGSDRLGWRQSYVTGYTAPSESQKPRHIKVIAPLSGCRLPAPAAGSGVRQAYVFTSRRPAGLRPISKGEIEDTAKTMMDAIAAGRGPRLSMSRDVEAMPVVDVFVTQPGKVHLVLSSASQIQWNVVPSPASEITGMTLLSRAAAAAVNLPKPGIPVSGLLGDAAKGCGAEPKPAPMTSFAGLTMAVPGSDEDGKRYYRKALSEYGSFRGFYESRFHADIDKTSVFVHEGDHLVVGPAPADPSNRLAYTGVEGADVVVVSDGTVVYGSSADAKQARRDAAVRLATKKAGVDFAAVAEKAGF